MRQLAEEIIVLSVLRLAASPLLSLFVLILGNGLFTTLVTLRLHQDQVSPLMIGAMTGFYYAGLIAASLKMEGFIIRVGHIRAFSAFAAGLAVISLLHGFFVVPWFWLLLRFCGGFATAGLFIVIESWLLVLGTVKIRGQILALYMVALYAAQGLGQFLIDLGSTQTLLLYAVTSMLTSLSIIPLAMTKVGSPQFEEPSGLSLKHLFSVASSGVMGCFAAGLILGAVYGLLPLFIVQKLGDNSNVALFMALTIFGGMALQYPVGRVSDHIERRTVLIGMTIAAIALSAAMVFAFKVSWISMPATFIFGGVVFTLYPISISHACDSLPAKDIVSGSQGLLLAYSVGAALGPFLAPLAMTDLGANGLFYYIGLVSILLCIFLFVRRVNTVAVHQEEHFISIPQTTPVAAELDPRGESS